MAGVVALVGVPAVGGAVAAVGVLVVVVSVPAVGVEAEAPPPGVVVEGDLGSAPGLLAGFEGWEGDCVISGEACTRASSLMRTLLSSSRALTRLSSWEESLWACWGDCPGFDWGAASEVGDVWADVVGAAAGVVVAIAIGEGCVAACTGTWF